MFDLDSDNRLAVAGARRSVFALWVGVWLCLCMGGHVCAQASRWQVIDRERGIEVAMREEKGRALPTLRGRGRLKGDVLSALAVILDAKRGTEWAEGADEARVLKRLGPSEILLYTYTELTWPVSDRDMVMKRHVEVVAPGKEYRVVYKHVAGVHPPREGTIRITDGGLSFHIKQVDPKHFWMEYQVNVDPGGALPKWLVRRASRSIPLETFLALERQIEKTRGQYADVKAKWAKGS